MNVGGFTNIACSFAAADSKGNPCLGSTRSYNLDLMNDVLDTGEYNGEKITVKSLYITLANPVSVYAQQGYIEEAFSKIDFIVVADQSMTDTAKWADILLPAADWYEQSDMYAACGTQPYLVWADKAMEPLYESKSDFDIYKMIVEKMGYGEFWGWKTNEDALAEVLDSDALREMGITFDKLKEEKVMRILPGDPYRPYEGGAFNTPTASIRKRRSLTPLARRSMSRRSASLIMSPLSRPTRPASCVRIILSICCLTTCVRVRTRNGGMSKCSPRLRRRL